MNTQPQQANSQTKQRRSPVQQHQRINFGRHSVQQQQTKQAQKTSGGATTLHNKNSLSRDQVHNFLEVENRVKQLVVAKSTSHIGIIQNVKAGKVNSKSSVKRMNQIPLYQAGKSILPSSLATVLQSPTNLSGLGPQQKATMRKLHLQASTASLQASAAVRAVQQTSKNDSQKPSFIKQGKQKSNSGSGNNPIMNRIAKNQQMQQHVMKQQVIPEHKRQKSPTLVQSLAKQGGGLRHQLSATDNLNVRIGQIFRGSKKSPINNNDRSNYKQFQEQLDQLFDLKRESRSLVDTEQINESRLTGPPRRINGAIMKAMCTSRSGGRMTKSRTSRKSPLQGHAVLSKFTNKSKRETKEEEQLKKKQPSETNVVQLNQQSRNGIVESTSPINLRITLQNSGGQTSCRSNATSVLEFSRQHQSKSHCKQRKQDNKIKPSQPEAVNLRKSFSIALLKADGSSNDLLKRFNNEYHLMKNMDSQQLPFRVNNCSQSAFALIKQQSESTNSMSSLGEVSINSVKQLPLKNNSHYGALKHLANNSRSKQQKTLFTRNSGLAQKLMTSLDENVRVNSIRETGTVNQKFSSKQQFSLQQNEIQNRFHSRKSYGSVCIMPQSVKNKPLFFSSVVDNQGNVQQSHQGDSRLSSHEENERHQQEQSVKGHKFVEDCKGSNIRLALSQANSPKHNPKDQLLQGKSQKLAKNPFMTNNTRKQSVSRDKQLPKPRRSTKNEAISFVAQQNSRRGNKNKNQAALKYNQTSNYHHTNVRTTNKASPFAMHRNSGTILPSSLNVSPQAKDEDSHKMKRQKFSISRELCGSGFIHKMALNSSISSKASRLIQDHQVFSSKRKSHGQIKSYKMSSAAKKRRASGTDFVPIAVGQNGGVEPMEAKQLIKMASISPTNYSVDEDNVVDKIVDLLDKRNLISQKSSINTKPKVSQILQSLLKSQLKKVSDSPHQSTSHVTKSYRQPSRLNTPLQLKQLDDIPAVEVDIGEVIIGASHVEHSDSEDNQSHNLADDKKGIPKVVKTAKTTRKSKKYLAKCKRTPAFKYPYPKLLKNNPPFSDDLQDCQPQLNIGEMTSPDELYYVDINNATASPNTSTTVLKKEQSSRIPDCDSNGQPIEEVSNRPNKNASAESRPSESESLCSAVNSTKKQTNQSHHLQEKQQQLPSPHNQYQLNSNTYGKTALKHVVNNKSQKMFQSNLLNSPNAYYAKQSQQEIQKESTRFSSNERERSIQQYQQQQQQQQQQHVKQQEVRSIQEEQVILSPQLHQKGDSKSVRNQRSSSMQHSKSKLQSRIVNENRQMDSAKQLELVSAEQSLYSYEEEQEDEVENEDSLIYSIRRHYNQSNSHILNYPSTLRCYRVQKIVGKGAFGTVALAEHKLTGKYVAIKTIDKSTLQPGQMEKLKCEVALMSAIRHKHIIRLLEVFESHQHMYMVFEYAAGGDLLQLVKRKRALTEREARPIFRQLVYGVAHCHCRSVLHRDIKLDNILLSDNGNVKVCDFGISRTLEDPSQPVLEQCGTPAYIAPEILYEDGYKGFKSDIWSLGVLLYAMVTGTVPFRAQNMRELKYVISAGQFTFPRENPRDLKPISPELKNLIRSILVVDIRQRISIPEILAHPWLNPSYQDHQSMQQGLKFKQLQSIHALQPFGVDGGSHLTSGESKSCVDQVRVENLFMGHGGDIAEPDQDDSQSNERVDSLSLTQNHLNEITIDHATVNINEKAIAQCETFGFPPKIVRQQVQNNVINHATASYHLLVL